MGNREESFYLSDFLRLLNRTDIFVDFTSASSIAVEWVGDEEGTIKKWKFLYQIILAKELALRLGHTDNSDPYSGFTPRIVAALIVQDLWLRNVDVALVE